MSKKKRNEELRTKFRKLAEVYWGDGHHWTDTELSFNEKPKVSLTGSSDSDGAWVQAWIWIKPEEKS